MRKLGSRGTLLFEAFVALMILSVGVTSTLKIFSEALFAGTRNQEKNEAIAELDHLLFKWFAYPGGVVLPEDGVLTLPLDSERFEDLYSVEIRSQNLKAKPEELEAERKIRSFEASQYYQVKCRVDKEHRKGVFDLGACVFRARGR